MIGRHIRNLFAEGELEREGNVQNLHIAGSDRLVLFYDLQHHAVVAKNATTGIRSGAIGPSPARRAPAPACIYSRMSYMLPYNRNLKPLARDLRSNMTEAEQRLWYRLRRKQVLDQQFYRQKPLAGYIADFYCAAAKLVIELDGAQHLETAAQERDRQRTAALQQLGLRVIRFDNRQVLLELEDVMSVIFAEVAKAIPPSPPFAKGGDKLADSAPYKQPGNLAHVHSSQARTTPPQTNAEHNSPLCKRGAGGDSPLASTPDSGETP
ncbi:endonuclease domain-containing protein [Pseudomonas sp. CAU 1711]|uniref:endonuclease domain-containing protein n=1 Tax=Pseudomonas sp. CAU 1711 TaxID=3140356 RepID=UPI0032602508